MNTLAVTSPRALEPPHGYVRHRKEGPRVHGQDPELDHGHDYDDRGRRPPVERTGSAIGDDGQDVLSATHDERNAEGTEHPMKVSTLPVTMAGVNGVE